MYRPEGWGNNSYDCSVCDTEPEGCPGCGSASYEAGADAMLEALKKEGLYGEYLEDYIISVAVKPDNPDWAEAFLAKIETDGWLVFIPDDKKEME